MVPPGVTPWLNEEEERFWRAFLEASGRVSQELGACMKAQSGLTLDDYDVLVHLSEAKAHRLPMGELSNRLLHSQSRLTQRVSRLQKRGLVGRQRSESDGRVIYAVLTAAGRQALDGSASAHVRDVRRVLLDHVAPHEFETVADVLARVALHLRRTSEESRRCWKIDVDDPRAEDVSALLRVHLSFANDHSPPEDVHALDVEGLEDRAVLFHSLRDSETDELLGVGALKELDGDHGELKSMHTVAAARGQGVGKALVTHLLELSCRRRYQRVSLETGTMEAFAPARALYESFGFEECPPFADYPDSPNSVYMTLALEDFARQ